MANETADRQLILAAHAGFVLTGVVTTLLGPLLPILSTAWLLNDAQAGYLFTAQSIGSLVGVSGSSRLIARLGLQPSLAVGFGLLALGVGALGLGGWTVGVGAVFLYGVGLGLTIPSTTLLVAEANPERRAAALNVLNFTWSLGAVLCAPVIGTLARRAGVAGPLLGLSVILGCAGVWLLSCRGVVRRVESDEGAGDQQPARLWRSPLLFLIGALVFLYVGVENSIGGWIASYTLRLNSATQSFWTIAPAIFWAAILTGRAVAPFVLRRLTADKLVLLGLSVAAIGIAALLSLQTPAGLLCGVALAGIGLAPVFPTTLAMLSQSFGPHAARVLALAFALAALGGATIPWIVGFISARSGSLYAGLFVTALCSVSMLALQLAIIRALGRAMRTPA